MRKKLLCFILSMSVVFSLSTSVFAAPLDSQKQKVDSEKKSEQQTQASLNQLDQSIEKLDTQIESLNKIIKSYNSKIADKQKQITTVEADLKKAQDDEKKEKDLFNARMRMLYMKGTSGYVEVLLNSKNFSDFISKAQVVGKLVGLDREIVNTLKNTQASIGQKKDVLSADKSNLVSLQAASQKQADNLTATKKKENAQIAVLNSHMSQIKAQEAKDVATLNATIKQLQAQEVAQSKAAAQTASRGGSISLTDGSGKTVSGNGLAVVEYAEQFLGKPYVYGAAGPNSFDCSGLVQYVYAHFGKKLDHSSYSQAGAGSAATGGLQPGDILIMNGGEHVGIYAGGGMMIEAPHTGANVRVASISGRGVCGARRIFN